MGNPPSTGFNFLEFIRSHRGSAAALPDLLSRLKLDDAGLQEYLNSEDPVLRLFGVVRMCAMASVGPRPEIALQLALPVWDAMAESLPAELQLTGSLIETICQSIAISIGEAAIGCGEADAAIRIADLVKGRFENGAPSIEENAIRGLIQKLRLAEARERYARIPSSPDLDRLLRDWRPVTRPDDILRPMPIDTRSHRERLDTAAREAAKAWIPDQRRLQRAQDTFRSELRSASDIAEFDAARAEMDAVLDLVEVQVANEVADNASEIFHQQIFRYQVAARRVERLVPTEVGNHQQARHAVNFAASVLSNTARTEEMLRAALSDLQSALAWFVLKANISGTAEANWALGLVHEELNEGPEALACYQTVLDILISAAHDLHDPAARAATMRSFPNVYPKIVRLGLRYGKVGIAFNASEVLRGTAYLRSAGPAFRAEDTPIVGWHYLSTFVDDEGCVVFLRLGDGTLYAHRPQIGREELDALTSRVPPADWHRSRLRDAGSPRGPLSSLLLPLRHAFSDGRMQSGDHLAVALDYPLNLVPLHYLDVLNRPIVHDLSFSRVASLGDAIDIDRAIVGGPVASACLVVIPAADNADRELHMQSAEEAIDPIREMVTLRRIKEDDTDKSSVQYALRNAQLVHIQAHGFFPLASPAETVDPLLQAGLLVSSNGEWPDRSRPELYLMSAREIIDGGPSGAMHVSLAACVSGLGRPGSAGDMLGTEFALRSLGVASVTASHWHVDLETASSFHAAFYRSWIVEGKSRAAAWRSAVLSLMAAYGANERDWARACAFSLYGSWR